MTAGVWGIVVAAGSGSRFGGAKQFVELRGRTVLAWSIDAVRAACEGVVVVVPAEARADLEGVADLVVAGGPSRAASVRAGLAAVPASADVVVVHDAARPLASSALFAAVIGAVTAGADGAIPGLPLADTIKQVSGGRVRATIDRSELVAVQTPQAFRAAVLRAAHEGAPEATDDAGLLERIGAHVAVVPGEAANQKLTEPADLGVLEWLAARTLVVAGDVPSFSDDSVGG